MLPIARCCRCCGRGSQDSCEARVEATVLSSSSMGMARAPQEGYFRKPQVWSFLIGPVLRGLGGAVVQVGQRRPKVPLSQSVKVRSLPQPFLQVLSRSGQTLGHRGSAPGPLLQLLPGQHPQSPEKATSHPRVPPNSVQRLSPDHPNLLPKQTKPHFQVPK